MVATLALGSGDASLIGTTGSQCDVTQRNTHALRLVTAGLHFFSVCNTVSHLKSSTFVSGVISVSVVKLKESVF